MVGEKTVPVARLMAKQQGHDEAWVRDQLERYRALAGRYGLGAQPHTEQEPVRAAPGD